MTGITERKALLLAHIRKGTAALPVVEELKDGAISLVGHESELWDYKLTIDGTKVALAETVRDILAFYNSFGGYLVIGVNDDALVMGAAAPGEQTLKQLVRNYAGIDIALVSTAVVINGVELGLIFVPKRPTDDVPAAVSRVGPDGVPGKPIFKPGEIFFRANDSSQLIRGSDDLRFLMGPRYHPMEGRAPAAIRLTPNNLPDRSVVFSRFFGREEEKHELWNWLADPLARYRVIAGPGGFGKTSATYSFCEEVCREAPLGIEQVVWLSAKREQFNPNTNAASPLPYQVGSRMFGESYSDFSTLLDALSFHFAITDEEWEGADEAYRSRLLLEALDVVPTLVVVDDLDSLSPDDQRMALAFAMSLGRSKSRFLFTTRKNYLAPKSATTQLGGLTERDFKEYVKHLQEAYSRTLNSSEVAALQKDTEGSPLFAESIFRLLRLGSRFGEALSRWKGKDGEAARAASFERELKQLSFASTRVLYAISLFDTASSAEIRQVTELEVPEVEGALQELDRLFLISSKEIGGQPRFATPPNLRRLLHELREQTVQGWKEIARRTQGLRAESDAGKARGRSRQVADAIQQAMAQLGRGETDQATLTIEGVLSANQDSADLWMVYARCLSRSDELNIDKARGAFTRSYALGKREPQLFQKWLEFEIEFGNSNAAVAVAERGNEVFGPDDWAWFEARARAHLKRAAEREKRREFPDAVADLKSTSKWVRQAVKHAPASARATVVAVGQQANDAMWRILCQPAAFLLAERFAGAKSAVEFGDRREVCIGRMVDVIDSALVDASFLAKNSAMVERWMDEVEHILRARASDRISARIGVLRSRMRHYYERQFKK